MKNRFLALLLLLQVAGVALAQPTPSASPVVLGTPTATPTNAAPSGPVSISATSDRAVIEVGQSLRVQVEIGYSEGIELKPVAPEKWEIKPFELQDAARALLPDEGPRRRVRYTLRVSAYEEGDLEFPALNLDYTKDGESHSVSSKPFAVKVNRVNSGKDDKPGEIRDLKQMDAASFPPLLIAAAVIVLLVLAWIVYKGLAWWRRPKAKVVEPALPPFEWARREMARIDREKIWEEGRFEEYYDQLTLVLRHYLGWRLKATLLEKTTNETLEALKDKPGLSYEAWRELRTILEEGDLTKFARIHPPAEKAGLHLQQARQLIDQLPPVESKDDKKGQQT